MQTTSTTGTMSCPGVPATAVPAPVPARELSLTASALAHDLRTPPAVIKLKVADEGIGIPADDLPHVFAPFYRGANAAGQAVGTGIGLASVRTIVERHGAGYDARSLLRALGWAKEAARRSERTVPNRAGWTPLIEEELPYEEHRTCRCARRRAPGRSHEDDG